MPKSHNLMLDFSELSSLFCSFTFISFIHSFIHSFVCCFFFFIFGFASTKHLISIHWTQQIQFPVRHSLKHNYIKHVYVRAFIYYLWYLVVTHSMLYIGENCEENQMLLQNLIFSPTVYFSHMHKHPLWQRDFNLFNFIHIPVIVRWLLFDVFAQFISVFFLRWNWYLVQQK